MPPTIIITRPQKQAEAFATDLEAAFGGPLPILIAPLMRIAPLTPDQPIGSPDHVIFTSINAVQQVERLRVPRSAKAWCVGDQTATAAKDAGFAAKSAGGNSRDLVAKIIASEPTGTFVHLRGAHVTGQVAETLAQADIPCVARVVYEQVAQPPTPELIEHLGGQSPVIAPLFSPRSARLLAESATISAPLHVVAMSESVARVAAAIPGADVSEANFPDKTAMIAATLRAFDKA